MKVISVTPIELSKAVSARTVAINMTTVLESQVEIGESFNIAIAEINKALSTIPKEYDDSKLKAEVLKLKKSIPTEYDDSAIKKKLDSVSELIVPKFDDSKINKRIKLLESATPVLIDSSKLKEETCSMVLSSGDIVNLSSSFTRMSEEIKLLKDDLVETKKKGAEQSAVLLKKLELNQSELKSARTNFGFQLDELRKRIDKIIEVK